MCTRGRSPPVPRSRFGLVCALVENLSEFSDGGCVLGHFGQVRELVWVFFVIVELGSALAVVPFGVAVTLGTDAAAHDAAMHDLCEGSLLPFAVGVVEQWSETCPLEPSRRRQAAERDEGGVEIN